MICGSASVGTVNLLIHVQRAETKKESLGASRKDLGTMLGTSTLLLLRESPEPTRLVLDGPAQ